MSDLFFRRFRAICEGENFDALFFEILPPVHRPLVTEFDRACVDDRAYKSEPARERNRLRVSGRCARMRR
jgi:hypothetical protein